MDFTDEQIYRYSRHIILPEVGGKGQRKLLESGVFLAGAGAVGSAAAFYLAGAGLGRIGIVDGATVSLADLQSQILHLTKDLHLAKSESAREKLGRLNPDVRLEVLAGPLTENGSTSLTIDRQEDLLRGYQVVLDATEDAACHYALNEACIALCLPLVVADVEGFEARVQTVIPGQGPCYRCLCPERFERPTGAILGPLGGVVGSILATETIKLLLSKGRPLSGKVLELDLLEMSFSLLPALRDADCPVCGRIQPGS